MHEPASLRSLSTSTGSEPLSLLICLHATKSVLLSVFTLIETICPIICSKSRPRSANSQLPVDVRRSNTDNAIVIVILLRVLAYWRNKLPAHRSFVILRSGEGLISFNKYNRANSVPVEECTIELSGMSVFFRRHQKTLS